MRSSSTFIASHAASASSYELVLKMVCPSGAGGLWLDVISVTALHGEVLAGMGKVVEVRKNAILARAGAAPSCRGNSC